MEDELITFWFNNEQLWFNCSKADDLLIIEKYYEFLHGKIIKASLGSIILYDQISRHVYRDNQERINYYLNIALEHCNYILHDIEKYNAKERCFILLPLRHTFNEDNIKKCVLLINKWQEEEYHPIYNRFYQASVQSLSKINSIKETIYLSNIQNYVLILDKNSTKKISFNFNKEIYNEKIYKDFSKNIIKNDRIIVSISGGVDSMVCACLLYYYSLKNNVMPIAASINYANREEQYSEIDMVNYWLSLLKIEHHVRVIDEIKRVRNNNRDFYEKITREIRFNLYKKLNGSVILGHNKDDSIENIFSNIKKKKSYDNLLGMSIHSKEQDVEILRPLLNIHKFDIIEFAQKYNIPYVYDSTPNWSERGQMRDILIPQIKRFDEEIINGLLELAHNYKEIYSVYRNNLIPQIEFNNNNCIFIHPKIYFIDYWKNVLNIICKHYNIPIVKNKSVINLISNIDTGNKIILSKQIQCQLIDVNINLNIIF